VNQNSFLSTAIGLPCTLLPLYLLYLTVAVKSLEFVNEKTEMEVYVITMRLMRLTCSVVLYIVKYYRDKKFEALHALNEVRQA
jgi:hypothetical protein